MKKCIGWCEIKFTGMLVQSCYIFGKSILPSLVSVINEVLNCNVNVKFLKYHNAEFINLYNCHTVKYSRRNVAITDSLLKVKNFLSFFTVTGISHSLSSLVR